MAEREEEQRRKDTALKTELQKIMASHFRKSRPVTSENHGQSLQKIMASHFRKSWPVTSENHGQSPEESGKADE
jgi:hypothetical protein